MQYIIMCGGQYDKWETPRQLTKIHGEPIVSRTIRLLRECGVEDIAISTNLPDFEGLGVPVIYHNTNSYHVSKDDSSEGFWTDAFYTTDYPVCYIFGDVVFSPEAIRTIVDTDTDSIEFFATAPPFPPEYIKPWAEPLALKVRDMDLLRKSILETNALSRIGYFLRKPIMWELWQVIKGTPLNMIAGNFVQIHDYTCDIDWPEDVPKIEEMIRKL